MRDRDQPYDTECTVNLDIPEGRFSGKFGVFRDVAHIKVKGHMEFI